MKEKKVEEERKEKRGEKESPKRRRGDSGYEDESTPFILLKKIPPQVSQKLLEEKKNTNQTFLLLLLLLFFLLPLPLFTDSPKHTITAQLPRGKNRRNGARNPSPSPVGSVGRSVGRVWAANEPCVTSCERARSGRSNSHRLNERHYEDVLTSRRRRRAGSSGRRCVAVGKGGRWERWSLGKERCELRCRRALRLHAVRTSYFFHHLNFFHLFFSSSSSSSSSRLPNCTLIVMQSRRLDPALIRNQLHEFPKQFGLQFTKRRERKRKTPQKRLWRHANETNPLQ